jgi:hypothetical protein
MEGVMPTKQKPRSRTWRQGRIPPEAIALFVELEHCSQRGPKFNAKARELAACSVSSANGGAVKVSSTEVLPPAIRPGTSRATIFIAAAWCASNC